MFFFRAFHLFAFRLIVLCTLCIGVSACVTLPELGVSAQAPASAPYVYTLSTGDEVSMRLEGEASMNTDAVLDATGKIGLPLIGYISVAGLTLSEASKTIESAYADGYYKAPRVLLTLKAARPFFVVGDVRAPGAYTYRDGLTVLEAVALSGGFSGGRDRADITIVRGKKTMRVTANDIALISIHAGDVLRVSRWHP